MQLTTYIILCLIGGKVTAEFKALRNITGFTLRNSILARQCAGTCVECFGAGNVVCVGLTCYDPSAGESCCDDGTYCPAGQTCTNIQGGCCNNGQSLQDCAASLGVPLPSSTAATAASTTPAPTATQGSSDSGTNTAGDWVSDHKGIIAGAAGGVALLLLLLACFGIYRRRKARNRSPSGPNAPPRGSAPYQTEDLGPRQYTYPSPQYQYSPVSQVRYTPK